MMMKKRRRGERFRKLQMRGVEGTRKEIERALAFGLAGEIRKNHGNVAAKFPDNLAASAAGRRERIRIGDHGDGFEILLALGNGFENRDALGADGEAVAGVFDVASGENASGFGVDRGADAKFREGRMSVIAGGAGGGNQLVFVMHGRIMPANR